MTGRIVVLASGDGTNCQALIDACQAGGLDATIVAIISNNRDAGVLARAEASGIAAHVMEHRGNEPTERHQADKGLIDLVGRCDPDLVVLAGWMRILGPNVGAAFPMINLHPAKPGEFPGIGSIERAYRAWTQGDIVESGVMVHWVPDGGVDEGPVILTQAVPFLAADTLDHFASRVHAVEHQLIVDATALALAAC